MAARVEGEVARARARAQRGLAVDGQLAGRRVECADPYGVGAEVDAEHPRPARVGQHLVGVRAPDAPGPGPCPRAAGRHAAAGAAGRRRGAR